MNIKKIFIYMVSALYILTTCQSTQSNGIIELDSVTDEIQEQIDPSYELQLLNLDENTAYIVIQTFGKLSSDLETEGDTFIIHFEGEEESGEATSQHVYELTIESEIESLEVYVDGELKPFDNITGI